MQQHLKWGTEVETVTFVLLWNRNVNKVGSVVLTGRGRMIETVSALPINQSSYLRLYLWWFSRIAEVKPGPPGTPWPAGSRLWCSLWWGWTCWSPAHCCSSPHSSLGLGSLITAQQHFTAEQTCTTFSAPRK